MLCQYKKINAEGDLAALNIPLGDEFCYHCNGHRKGKDCRVVCHCMKCPGVYALPVCGSGEL